MRRYRLPSFNFCASLSQDMHRIAATLETSNGMHTEKVHLCSAHKQQQIHSKSAAINIRSNAVIAGNSGHSGHLIESSRL